MRRGNVLFQGRGRLVHQPSYGSCRSQSQRLTFVNIGLKNSINLTWSSVWFHWSFQIDSFGWSDGIFGCVIWPPEETTSLMCTIRIRQPRDDSHVLQVTMAWPRVRSGMILEHDVLDSNLDFRLDYDLISPLHWNSVLSTALGTCWGPQRVGWTPKSFEKFHSSLAIIFLASCGNARCCSDLLMCLCHSVEGH